MSVKDPEIRYQEVKTKNGLKSIGYQILLLRFKNLLIRQINMGGSIHIYNDVLCHVCCINQFTFSTCSSDGDTACGFEVGEGPVPLTPGPPGEEGVTDLALGECWDSPR